MDCSWHGSLRHKARTRLAAVGTLLGLMCILNSLACDCRPTSPPPTDTTVPDTQPETPETQPASQPTDTAPATAPATAPETAPATEPSEIAETQPATQPALPESTYDPRPPYTVRLYVQDPEPDEEQPGWLRIIEQSAQGELATCFGQFPRHNRIEIETHNVQQLRLEVGFLPMAPDRRIILSIDGQTMELARRDRRHIWLRRSTTTGGWFVADSD